jgi:hypothetical protein
MYANGGTRGAVLDGMVDKLWQGRQINIVGFERTNHYYTGSMRKSNLRVAGRAGQRKHGTHKRQGLSGW